MPAGDAPLALSGVSALVTGATGKLGRALVEELLAQGAVVSVLTRSAGKAARCWPDQNVGVRVGDLTSSESLEAALEGVSLLFHLASHSPPPGTADLYGQPAHWAVSAIGTWHLVAAARRQRVSRLIYVSSVMAMGSGTALGSQPAHEETPSAPDTVYGRAKREAECAVLALGASLPEQVHVSVIRLPMVYGLDGAGNLDRLVAAVANGRFPPFPRLYNRRSAVHAADAIQGIRLVSTRREAAGKVYLVTDGEAYSTRWIYEEACRALGRPLPSWSIPVWSLRGAAKLGDALQRLTGRPPPMSTAHLRKLLGDAWYGNERIRNDLGFVAQHRMRDEIERLARRHRREIHSN
jgi:UDP-glucose 4-epimerase